MQGWQGTGNLVADCKVIMGDRFVWAEEYMRREDSNAVFRKNQCYCTCI